MLVVPMFPVWLGARPFAVRPPGAPPADVRPEVATDTWAVRAREARARATGANWMSGFPLVNALSWGISEWCSPGGSVAPELLPEGF